MFTRYLDKRKERGLENTLDYRELGIIRRRLKEEYNIQPEQDWFDRITSGVR